MAGTAGQRQRGAWRRGSAWLAALALVGAAALGHGSAAWGQPPNQLTVLLEAAPATLDPVYAADAYGVRISNQLLFETLVRLGDDLQVVPGLARSWRKLSPTRFRFELQRGVKFQDGSVLTADDVVYTLTSLMDPRTGSPYGAMLREKIQAVRAQGPLSVEVHLKAPFASFLTDLVLPIRS
ncbi:MAG TPA: ABC transporter substrate-binding protein, partial [bacterium]|nr:ABC transporter substrate-binding protein [bacterium]